MLQGKEALLSRFPKSNNFSATNLSFTFFFGLISVEISEVPECFLRHIDPRAESILCGLVRISRPCLDGESHPRLSRH